MDDGFRYSASKLLSLILRHKPEKFNLKLDKNGWVNVNELLTNINNSSLNKVGILTNENILEIVNKCDKQRYQLNQDFTAIRANQGHSIEVDLQLDIQIPPKYLYHGSNIHVKDIILESGINKMSRQYVHMTENIREVVINDEAMLRQEAIQTAINVGKRSSKTPLVFVINTTEMIRNGIVFYKSNNNVWLTNYVAPEYILPFEIDYKCGCAGIIILNENKTKTLLVKANEYGFPKGKKIKQKHILIVL